MENFAADIFHGLMANPKKIPAKYFYDREGSRLYNHITATEEYYPWKCESEILQRNKEDLLVQILKYHKRFQLIEFGSGSGEKTRILLDHFLKSGADFEYVPVDICGDENDKLVSELSKLFPSLEVNSITGEFLETLNMIPSDPGEGRVILFLGSTIGNLEKEQTHEFLSRLKDRMNHNDLLLTGFDLRKHPKLIASAYNDTAGYTRQFNLNLLKRINRELEADFNPDQFEHYPVYDPISGEARSFLVSTSNQEVFIRKLGKIFLFNEGEVIFTEVSRKYTLDEIDALSKASGFNVVKHYQDSKCYFVDSLWKK